MIGLNLLSVLAVLMITLFCEAGWGTRAEAPQAAPAERQCNERRLLRFRQLSNLYSARNWPLGGLSDKQKSELRAFDATMDKTWYPRISRKTFEETTQLLLENGEELRKLLLAEIGANRNAETAKQNLKYLDDKLTKRVSDCAAFSGSFKEWEREFERVGLNPQARSPVLAQAPPAAAPALRPLTPPRPATHEIQIVVVPDESPAAQ